MTAEMNTREETLRKRHMVRINEKKCSPEFTVIYIDVVHNIEKTGDYCNNIEDILITSEETES